VHVLVSSTVVVVLQLVVVVVVSLVSTMLIRSGIVTSFAVQLSNLVFVLYICVIICESHECLKGFWTLIM
jgi:hypothetical protein